MSAAAIEPAVRCSVERSTLPGLAVITVAAVIAAIGFHAIRQGPNPDPPDLVTIAPGAFAYREAGEFLQDGNPVDSPLTAVVFSGSLSIMKRQVSRAEYDQCVADGACRRIAPESGPDAASVPATGVSWTDATDYAAWLSQATGHRYRLPTDAEWAYAAKDVFRDDSLGEAGRTENPAARWLAAYDKESAEAPIDPRPLPFGSFGVNANGLQDLGGNVWEWTDTCYVRHAADADGGRTSIESCGVRVVEGGHRTYIGDFVRDARGGACSAGVPPANLGIRLVRDDR